ncbi:MAG: TatD family hydrolase [Peptococcaceae bacterium]|jgi:TatD DNase family protein|nr:TatD family hydrolase [Peptococcaceae bacterium]
MFIDTHAHLDDEQFAADLPAVLDRARAAGVGAIVNASYDLASAGRAAGMASVYPWIYATCGIHPHGAAVVPEDYLERLRELLARPGVVALGEIGLDYYRNLSPRADQQRVFREQLALARELNLPVVIHNRDAHADVFDILSSDGVGPAGGIMHCFSGGWEMAGRFMGLGLYISLAGPVTFTNAPRLAEVAQKLPLERILVETDCPYLAPHPYRGRRNEPAYVRLVAEKVALLRGMGVEELSARAAQNACLAFGLGSGAGA